MKTNCTNILQAMDARLSAFTWSGLVRSLALALVALTIGSVQAANYYWDSNGTTAGLGNTAGTWGSSAYAGTIPNGGFVDGTGTVSAPTFASGDFIYFGTVNLALGSTASTIGTSGSLNISTIVFGAGQGSQGVTLGSGATSVTLGSSPSIVANNTGVNTIGAVLAGTAGMTMVGPGALTLTGAETYTGTTIVSAGGTLTIGNGTSGNLNNTTPSALTFNAGAGVFNWVAASAGSSQSMGALTFSAGEGTVQSTYGASGNAFLTFASLAARTAGASGNFIVSGGSIGSNNKIVLTGATAGTLLDKGLFFGGADYAAYDSGGYVRAFNYTTPDAGGVDLNLSGDQATLGTISSTTNLQLRGTGNITAQTGGTTLNTLKISGNHTVTLLGQLQEIGILQTGGSSTITGGNLKANATGGEIVIRVDQAGDALNISSPILVNGSASLTKSGAGTLTLSGANTYTGNTTINAGTLALSGGSAIADAGAVVMANAASATLLLNNSETIGNLSGGGFAGGNVNIQGNTLTLGDANNKTFGGQFIGTSSGNIIKQGSSTLTLANKNTFTGTITLNAGALAFSYGNDNSAAPAPLSSGGVIVMAGGTSLNMAPVANVAAGVSAAQQQNIFGGWSISNPIIVSSGTASIKTQGNDPKWNFSGGVTGAASGTQTFAILEGALATGGGDRQDILISGVIANGSGGTLGVNVDFQGASGTAQDAYVALSGQNTFTGPISVSNTRGLLSVFQSQGGYLAIGGDIIHQSFSSRIVYVGSGYLGGGSYSGNISLATGTFLVYCSSASQTLSGTISGGGSVAIEGSGAGTLTLSTNNTYSGATLVTAGKLIGVVGGSCSNSAVVVSGGTLGTSVTDTNLQWACASLTHSAASTLEFAFGANTPSTTVAPLQVNGNVVFSVVPAVSCTGSSLPLGTYPLMKWTGTFFGAPPSILTLPSGTGNLLVDPVTKTLWLSISASGGSKQPLTWKGPAGSTWVANEAVYTKWQDATPVNTNYQETVVSGVTVGDNVVFGATGAGTVTLNTNVSPASVAVNTTANYTFSGTGSIAGPGGLIKANTGSLTLSTTNSYSGGTILSAGTLVLGTDSALGAGPLVISGGTLQSSDATARTLNNTVALNGSSTVGGTGNLTFNNSGAGTLTANSQVTVSSSTVNATFGTSFGGTFTLTKAGPGTMTLTGTNTYAGTTTVSAGRLVVNGGLITNNAAVYVTGGISTMVITNGAKVFSGGATSQIGNNNSTNLVLVVGGGATPSVWDLGGQFLNLGGNSYQVSPSNNVLRVDGAGVYGGAVVTNVNGTFSSTAVSGGSAYSADYSSIVLTNGGHFFNKGLTAIGNNYYGPHGSYDSLVIVGGVANSMYYGSSNAFIVADGIRPGAHDNRVWVGAGGVLTNVGYYATDRYVDFVIGFGHFANNPPGTLYNNQLVVTDGGKVSMLGNLTVGYSDATANNTVSAMSNSVLIANGGVVNAPGALFVGVNRGTLTLVSYNSLTITNGGRLFTGADSFIGYSTATGCTNYSNTALISGAYNGTSALWNLGNKNLIVGSATGTGRATGNVFRVSADGVATNINALIVSGTNTLSLGAGGLIYAGAVTNSGTMAVGLDKNVTPASGCLIVTGNLNVNNATLDVSISGKPNGTYVIASYYGGSLTGAFAATNGLSDKYRLEMDYKGQKQIAIVYTAAGTLISFQ